MFGLILWYKPDPGLGMIWCEDQGPLAFIGPEVPLPGGTEFLECGDQLVFDFELRDGVRFVRDILSHTAGSGGLEPAEIVARYHQALGQQAREQEARDAEPVLRVVA